MKPYFFLFLVVMLIACSPSEADISTANAETQAAIPSPTISSRPTAANTPTPIPKPTLAPTAGSLVLIPRFMLPSAPGTTAEILEAACNYQRDSWNDQSAYIAYTCPDLNVTWLSVVFTNLEPGETAQDLFGQLPGEGSTRINPAVLLSGYDNLILTGRIANSEYAYFMVYETESFVISSEVFFPGGTAATLEEFYPDNGETVLHAVLEIVLEKTRTGATSLEPTPMTVTQQQLYDQIAHWLITQAEANEFYMGASDMFGTPVNGTWVLLGDNVNTISERASVCRNFEDRTNEDVPLVAFSNCVYHVGTDFELSELQENFSNAIVLESAFEYPDQIIIYGSQNGHTFFQAFVLKGEYLIAVSVESRTLSGQTPEVVFNEFNDGFIYGVLMTNLKRYDG